VAIPYMNVATSREVRQRSPSADQVYVTDSFVGTAHALRRDVFIGLGGYRESLFHQGEERDYCIRMLAAGYVVRLGRAAPIHHFESPKRDTTRMDHYGRRNDILFAWANVPAPYLAAHLLGTTIHGLAHAWRCGKVRTHAAGIWAGYTDMHGVGRRPVDVRTYRLNRLLRRQREVPLTAIEQQLRPI
jgi:GT2 family glycosyltransferase